MISSKRGGARMLQWPDAGKTLIMQGHATADRRGDSRNNGGEVEAE